MKKKVFFSKYKKYKTKQKIQKQIENKYKNKLKKVKKKLKKISNFRPDRDYVTVLPEDFMSERPEIRKNFLEKGRDFSGKGACRANAYFETDEVQQIRRVLSGHKKIHKDFPKICAVCDHTTWSEDFSV